MLQRAPKFRLMLLAAAAAVLSDPVTPQEVPSPPVVITPSNPVLSSTCDLLRGTTAVKRGIAVTDFAKEMAVAIAERKNTVDESYFCRPPLTAKGRYIAPSPAPVPAPIPPEGAWTTVAQEGEPFKLAAAAAVRYGIDARWASRQLAAGTYRCTHEGAEPKAALADPAAGRNKVCQVAGAAPSPNPVPPAPPASSPTPPPPPPPAPPPPAPAPSPTPMPTPGLTAVNPALVPVGQLYSASAFAGRRINGPPGEMPYRDPDGMGAFRTVCAASHFNFDDMLVKAGQPGTAHLHLYFGNAAVTGNSTPESVRTSGASTCRGGIVNRSAYWVPAVIDTRTGTPVTPANDSDGARTDVYYKTGYDLFGQNAAVQPFPVGFRMIGGDSKSRVAQQHQYFECGDDSQGGTRIADMTCNRAWLRQIVEFPQCWDGVNLSSPDFRSHIVPASNGRCPAGYPRQMPEITVIVKYRVPPGGTGAWRLSSDSNGAPAGSSGHGDWVNGWEQEVHETFVQRVIRQGLSGGSHIVGDGRTIY